MRCTIKDSNFKRLNEINRSAFYRRVQRFLTNRNVGNDLRVVPLYKVLGYPKNYWKIRYIFPACYSTGQI